jgi:hypothetical protein
LLAGLFSVFAVTSTASADDAPARTAHVSFEVPSDSYALYELRQVEEVREGWGKMRRVRSEKFERLCYSPCEVSLPAGTHTLAVATKDGDPVAAPPITLREGSHRLTAEYTDNSGTRGAGTGLALLSGVLLSVSAYGGTRQAGGDGSGRTLAVAGGVIGLIGVIGGIAMTFTEDTVVFTLNPESDSDGQRWSASDERAVARSGSAFGAF